MKSVYFSSSAPRTVLLFLPRWRWEPDIVYIRLNELPTQGICVNTAPQPETIWKGFSTTDTPFTEKRHT